ncbi:MAG: isoleucine--tRNA ligase [Verrucomicrobiota bacterium]|nr:isoleucine--tRNA ligase [Verrucomicrobiota bacterium]
MNQANKLKDTLNLPQTEFPMRANAVENEPQRITHWEDSRVYEKTLQKNKDSKAFVLHDGPPFTNGDVHVGTALNKILKDTIIRFKNAQGFSTPYVPGWDCHGLPIEFKVTKKLREKKHEYDNLSLRKSCADFSKSYIETQRRQFKRLGVLADWEKEYRTMNPAYEAEILRTFADFVDKGLIYRSKKPIYWSIPCSTALAEAEIEYKDHISPSIYVPFKIIDDQVNVSIVIWTTTPWTLPANMAVAVHPREKYAKIHSKNSYYWVGESLVEHFIKTCNLEEAEVVTTIEGKDLAGKICQHPFIERESPVLEAEYVTMDSGTGCVHIAPGHGLDDYLTGLEHGIEVYCPLDDNGCYVKDGLIPDELVGLSVLEKANGCMANQKVLEILERDNRLLAKENHHHQYPHCWRSKTPVVFRAMDQWFVSLDKNDLRSNCIEKLQEVNFTPEWGSNRIKGFLESRPDWCISRQRAWGVPIPVFFDKEGNPLLDANLIRHLASKVEKHGSDLWFSSEEDSLIDGYELDDPWKGKELFKGKDTLDVWIDSGCSHRSVLRNDDSLTWPADLYLEGSDQHRGWFQSSLWTSMTSYGKAPYKRILTHGFVVDGEGRKISKSDGKPQTADSYVGKYGADVIRLWVCSEDFRRDIPLSEEILDQVVRSYRTLRNTIRFQLGNLSDFIWEEHSLPTEKLDLIDRWAISKTAELVHELTEAMESYELHRAVQLINRFCTGVLSSTYHDVIKDRLYTLHPDDFRRRSTQTALHEIFETFIKLIGPIIPFTADEAWSFHRTNQKLSSEFLVLEHWPEVMEEWINSSQAKDCQMLLDLKDSKINEVLESLRTTKEIGQSLDAEIVIACPYENPLYDVLTRNSEDLTELFIVSSVIIKGDEGSGEIKIDAKHASGVRCPRSWRWVPELVEVENWGSVSPRCAEVLSKITN